MKLLFFIGSILLFGSPVCAMNTSALSLSSISALGSDEVMESDSDEFDEEKAGASMQESANPEQQIEEVMRVSSHDLRDCCTYIGLIVSVGCPIVLAVAALSFGAY